MWLLCVVVIGGFTTAFVLWKKVKLCALFCGRHKKELHRFVVLLLGQTHTHTQPFGTCWILKQKYEKCVVFDFLECVTLAGFGTLAFLCFCALNG